MGGLVTPGQGHHCSKSSMFVDGGSHHSWLESRGLRNGFVGLSTTIDETLSAVWQLLVLRN